MDSSIDPSADDTDTMNGAVELPVAVDSLAIGGTPPEVGDTVKLRVNGNVTRVVNDMAYVRPTEINDMPMKPAIEPNPQVSEEDRLKQLSQSADSSMGY